MKKLLILLAALSIFGCQNNDLDDQEQDSGTKTFIATIETGEMNPDGDVLWKKGDEVSVFDGSTTNQQYKVTDASDGKTSAELEKVSSFEAGAAIDNNVAFYPYTSLASISSNYVISNITLPSTQNYVEGSFGNGAFPMVAVTTSTSDKNLNFKNVLGGIKLQLKGTATISSIEITGNNEEILCGDASITASTGSTPSITLTDESSITVTLDCGDGGVQLNSTTATSFIIALPPMTMTSGFTVTVSDTDGGIMIIETDKSKSQTISRSSILKMPEKTYIGYVDLGLPSGTLWATTNIGASKPSDYGDYFAWADIYSKDEYTWDNLSYYLEEKGGYPQFYKYVATNAYGDVDNKTVLEVDDDAATANWGSNWRMPTSAEWQELYNSSNCTWIWTTEGGNNGYKVTSKKNGNSIFLPAAGGYDGSSLYYVGVYGCYWSSSLDAEESYNAYVCLFNSSTVDPSSVCLRYCGQSVRPVYSSSQN